MVGMTITAAVLLALVCAVRLTRMVQVLDAVSLASAAQADVMVHRTVHGNWPAPGDERVVSPELHGTYTRRLALESGGVVSADLRLGRAVFTTDGLPPHVEGGVRGQLSFRPVLLGAEDAPTFIYLCGGAPPPAGAVAAPAADRTTLSRDVLPPFCR